MQQDHHPRGPDLLALALFLLGWSAATSLWPGFVPIPEPPLPIALPGGPGGGQPPLGPPGVGSLRSLVHLGVWRAEQVAEALWEGLDPHSPRAQGELESLPGIGPVSAGALLAGYPRLVRLLHWRRPGPLVPTPSGIPSNAEPTSLPAARSPARSP